MTAQEANKPKRRVVRRRKTEESETPVVVPVEAAEEEQPVAKRRTVTRRKKVEDVTPESMTAATSEEVPAEAELPARPKRTRRTVKADAVTEQESAKKPRTRKIKAEPEVVEASEQIEPQGQPEAQAESVAEETDVKRIDAPKVGAKFAIPSACEMFSPKTKAWPFRKTRRPLMQNSVPLRCLIRRCLPRGRPLKKANLSSKAKNCTRFLLISAWAVVAIWSS